MTQKDLQDIFESEFNWSNWKKVMNFVFPEFEFNLVQNDLTRDIKAHKKSAGYIKEHGSGKLKDDVTLTLCEILVTDAVRLDRNIKSVRSLVADLSIPHFQTIVAVFHNADKTKWRFTLVVREFLGDGKIVDKKPDSYTYVFGLREKGRTASERFYKLSQKSHKTLKDLEDAFSVEALSKKFFNEYKFVYQKFVDDIVTNPSRLSQFKESSKEKSEKAARDFVKKMMGRLVFLYFLQKKGWLGCKKKWKEGDEEFMKTFVTKAKQDDIFYHNYLEPLFFDTLNDKRTRIDEDCIIQKIDFGKVPYLNGGLFEKDENHPKVLTLPWEDFKTLFDTLNNYNFTIIEDDPEFKEVAVDPEMLGHIFENLLEDNRDKGAFYTPKEIVHYMCQESLYEYLRTYLQQNNHWPKEKKESALVEKSLYNFVTQKTAGKIIDLDKPLAIALKEVKICDPAIGSGAFPMGLLMEIFHCVHVLYNASPDVTGPVWDMDNWQPNKVKLNIIQNSIYGVDTEKGAVDIARLRFWLSLIVDEDEPKPLPNLDFKIVVGDSLLPKFESNVLVIDWNLKSSTVESEQPDLINEHSRLNKNIQKLQIENLAKVVHKQKKYFTTDESKKEKVLAEIQMLKLEILLGQVKQELIKIGKHKEAFGQTGLFTNAQTKKQIEIQEQESKLKNLEKRIGKKISNKETDFIHFDWKLDFPEILNELLTDEPGFDIVIGNPPYIQLQKIVEYSNDLEQVDFDTYTRGGDIYCLFYEQGIGLLKNNGVLTFITSNSWLKTQYGEPLRKYFIDNTNPLKLLNFEDTKIFPTATVEANILISQRGEFKNILEAVVVKPSYSEKTPLGDYFSDNSIRLEELSIDGWIILTKQDYELKLKVEGIAQPLKTFDIKINFGIKTGLNEAFIIDSAIRDELIAKNKRNEEIIKPLIRGRDVKGYSYKFENLYVIFTKRGVNINEYKEIENYLMQFYDRLKPRTKKSDTVGRKPGPYKWYEIQDNVAYYTEFEKPKLVWGELSDKPKFAYDNKGMYPEATLFFMTGENIKYLLSILNSRLASWYFSKITTTSGMGTNRWKKYKIEQLPIATPREIQKFEILVDYLIYLNNPTNSQVNQYVENIKLAPVFEDVLNMMVYELYFDQHMKESELDVLKYIDEKNVFKSIDNLESQSEKCQVVNNAYGILQQPENPIRNRIISANIRSEDIIRRINSTTH